MKQIKTITEAIGCSPQFDMQVNALIEEGWWLARRDFITPANGDPLLYAELEIEIEEEEDDDFAEWIRTRNPQAPIKCSHCGFNPDLDEFYSGPDLPPMDRCPDCGWPMLNPDILDK